ncbi:MAG: hypothetical protein Q4E84_02760 [Clostridia bacterium]|nr:hypothetical protein [Clostridia bacterium]
MINKVIKIEEKDIYPSARERFIKTNRFDLSRPEHKNLMDMSETLREKHLDQINVQAVVSYYDSVVFNNSHVIAEDQDIYCNFFSQIPEDAVEGIFFYALTAGEWSCSEDSSEKNIMDELFADIWGTSYVDAGKEFLEKKFLWKSIATRYQNRKTFISGSFGPGYYGMAIQDSEKFLKILDGNLIDVRTNESGLMLPQKTCTGLYFILNRSDIRPEPSCVQCLGNPAGCDFCAIRENLRGKRRDTNDYIFTKEY